MQKFLLRLRIILSILLSIIVVLYLIGFPFLFHLEKNKNMLNKIYGTSVQTIVLDLWHIEDFEGGNNSMKKYLEKISKAFSGQNKGVYVAIRDMSIQEYVINAENGLPDIISFGKSSQVFDSLIGLSNISQIKSIIDDIVIDQEVLAYPYMIGRYVLISRDPFDKGLPTVVKKNKSKIIYPFGYSKDILGYTFLSELGYAIPRDCKVYDTQYLLYKAFLAGEITCMLGSQRDLHRLKAREERGDIDALHYVYLDGKTDLIQNIGVTKQSKNADVAKAFCQFVMQKQKDISFYGMFSAVENVYTEGYMYEFEKSIRKTILVR